MPRREAAGRNAEGSSDMVMKRTKQPWMRADDFGRSLPRGIGINLLVTDIAPTEEFLRLVLGANTIHADEDFAAIELLGSVLMLHADHSYLDHEMTGVTAGVEIRGAGIEIRVYGADPDRAEAQCKTARPHDTGRQHGQAARSARMPYRRAGRLHLRAEPGDLTDLRDGNRILTI